LAGPDSGFPDFWEVVADSPALRARGREALEEIENALADALTGTAPDTSDPALTAALTVAAYRAVYVATARRVFAGEGAEGLVADHRARVCAAFDALERALTPA
jgi:hypothetical protein